MISFPNCKINLGLNIIGKRSDGYHDISSVMYPVPFNEILEIVAISGKGFCEFESSGIEIPGKQENNLCIQAYQLLNEKFQLPAVHIHLHKIIPMGGGLGGGSSDAAETIKTLNTIFDLQLSIDEMKSFAVNLGSDCPFFIENTPQLAQGRGEVLTPIDISLKGYYLVLINDGTHVSTKEAYTGIQPKTPSFHLNELACLPIEEWKYQIHNDFEESVFKKHPNLKQIKEDCYRKGAVYASMTGSGATVFGISKKSSFGTLMKSQYLNTKVFKIK